MPARTIIRAGLTMMELLVVLVILSILTVVAVQSTDVVIDQGRFEATQKSLQSIRDAIMGPTNQLNPDGTVLVTGFVADTGRFPNTLDELLTKPNDLMGYELKAATSDAQVRIGTGWRGPYVHLPVGTGNYRDGWGQVFQWGNSPLGDFVRSIGADGTQDTADDLITIMSLGQRHGDVSGTVRTIVSGQSANPDPADGDVIVRVYEPRLSGVFEHSVTIDIDTAPGGLVTYTFPSITVGPRVVRAYQGTKSSQLMRITITAGGGTLPDLILR